jgi:hypothetical protein
MDSPLFNCQSYRRFGVEIEINTLDGSARRPDTENGEISLGADILAHIVHKATKERVEIQSWDYIHNNSDWVIKHDTSCGMEINSPVLKGWTGLKKLVRVAEMIGESSLEADRRCSLHVHINISDLSKAQLASVIAYYIKCEHVLFDSFPDHRKNNRYCQFLGMSDMFSHDYRINADDIIHKVSSTKYFSLNAYHFMRGGGFTDDNSRRLSVEIRMAENTGCVDPYFMKNWIRLLLHFFDVTKNLPAPYDYTEGDPWSGLLWLDTRDVMALLGFDNESHLSEGLKQVRSWFINRLRENTICDLPGIWSKAGRYKNWTDIPETSEVKDEDYLYGKRYVV